MSKKIFIEECIGILEKVRNKKPLVHHITNYVTVNDCANITLAIGASPIMADAIEEAGEIVSISSSLVLNIGTLNKRTVESMIAAGKKANEKNIPVIFDPVGAGASSFRNSTTKDILEKVKINILRGNISEIRYIAGLNSRTKGVDASESDASNSSGEAAGIANTLSKKLKCIVAITGAIDVVSDGTRTIYVENGHQALSNITGTGCMCSSLVGSFNGAAPDLPLQATAAALLCMGIAGEIAFEKAGKLGNGSFRSAIIDSVSNMNKNILLKRSKFHEK
jgi:hydroxyethylthiazole kinase